MEKHELHEILTVVINYVRLTENYTATFQSED